MVEFVSMDSHALPEDHVLKPLEDRLFEMADEWDGAFDVLFGNAIAALRVFAAQHPNLSD